MDINKFKNMIEEVCDVSIENIDEDSKLKDLGLDSLDIAQVIFAVESDLDVSIDSDSLTNLVTVGDALKAIQNAKAD